MPTTTIAGGVNLPVSGNLLKIDSDSWKVEFEEGEATSVTATGSVKATYREFTVTSANLSADLKTKIATFSDNVALTVEKGQTVHGTKLTVNLDNREWSFETAKSELKPDLFPQQIKAPIFLTGQIITGRSDKVVTVSHGGFTTCNLDHPHYFIDSATATVFPGSKLIARNSTFYALGRKIFRIARIAIPLKQISDRQNLLPKIGQTAEEGMFIKAAYSVSATERNSGNLKLDLMSKKGIGLGFEDTYNLKRNSGNGGLQLYRVHDMNRNLDTMTGRFTHQQKIGTITANLSSDYRANSYQYSPASTSLANEVRLSRSRTGATTTFAIRQTSDTGFGKFLNLASNLQHTQTFSKDSSATIGFDYFRNTSPIFISGQSVQAANAQLVSKLDYTQRGGWYDWKLRVNKIDDLSDESFIAQSGSRFAGTERLPELELATSSDKLKKFLPYGLPAKLDLAFGRYREDLGRVDTERVVVDLGVPTQNYKLGSQLSLNTGGDFRQYLYGDGTAQYSLDTAAELSQKIGKKSSAALTYRYLNPQGFTPFRFDFVGKYNVINARVNIQETSKIKLSLMSGFNFGQKDFPWQDITARLSWAPSDRYLLYTGTGYDLNRRQWRALSNQLRVRLPGDFKLDVGSRYDIVHGKISTVKTQLDTPVTKRWHVRALTGYNGFTKSFDYRNIELVRDLHCWELAIAWVDQTGIWQERGLRVNLRIKAFPMFDSFGVGQFGQGLDTSVGEVL